MKSDIFSMPWRVWGRRIPARPEIAVINRIRQAFDKPFPGVLQGIGDDCAVVRLGKKNYLVTTDVLLEGVHFLPETVPPRRLGRKALAVNLSDIAAMGGRPLFAFLNLGLPKPVPTKILGSFISGFRQEADRYGLALLGGDTFYSPERISLGITVIGEAGDSIPYRSQAKVGDRIFVSGCLGDAAAGLDLLTRAGEVPGGLLKKYHQQLIAAHQDPVPQIPLGRFLVSGGYARAMIDLSDGLATDLRHICQASRVGAIIEEEKIPLSKALRAAGPHLNHPLLYFALQGGEDYQLLFTSAKGSVLALQKETLDRFQVRLTEIGEIISGDKIFIRKNGKIKKLKVYGYDHFQ